MNSVKISATVVLATALSASASPSFQGLGLASQDDVLSIAWSISGDGNTVGGFSGSAYNNWEGTAFTWTEAGGMSPLPEGEDGFPLSFSYDGSVAVGTTSFQGAYAVPIGLGAVRWAAGTRTDIVPVPTWGAAAADVTADGQTVVGSELTLTPRAWKWTAQGGKISIPELGTATAISADGSVIAGSFDREDPQTGEPRATARVLRNGQVIDLGESTIRSDAISADGSVVVGITSAGSTAIEPFRWTEETGTVNLGMPGDWYGPNDQCRLRGANADGSVLVGWASLWGDQQIDDAAVIWDETHGLRFLQDVLETEYGLDLTGWDLELANDISDDGLTIVGQGRNPEGHNEAWVVRLPEPTTGILLLAAGFVLRSRHRVSSRPG